MQLVPLSAGAWSSSLALEAGGINISTPQKTNEWRTNLGASLKTSLFDLISLEGHLCKRGSTIYGASLAYALDIASVEPWLELGIAHVSTKFPKGRQEDPMAPFLGVGLDLKLAKRFFIGALFRYYALEGTAVLDNPAYKAINIRWGVLLGDGF